MPNSVLDLSPPPTTLQYLATGPKASVATPFSRNDDDDIVTHCGRFTNGNLRNAFAIINFGEDGGSVPSPGQVILSAELRLRAELSNSLLCPVTVGLLSKDSLWNHPFSVSTIESTSVPNNDTQSWVTTDVFATLSGSSSFTSLANWPMKSKLVIDTVFELGQAFTCDTSGVVGFIFTSVARTGSRPGVNTNMDLYAAAANDGSDDRPVGSPIATSVDKGFDTVPLTTPGLNGWDFRPSAPSIVAGNRYVWRIRYPSSSGAPFLRLGTRNDNSYAGGSLITYGIHGRFSEPHYPEIGLLPHLYESDGSTIRTAAFGATIDVNMPNFVTIGSTYAITGLASLVQEWIDDGGYAAGGVIGFQIAARAGGAVGAYRSFDFAQLALTYADAVNASASAQVLWSASMAQPTILGCPEGKPNAQLAVSGDHSVKLAVAGMSDIKLAVDGDEENC